MLYQKNFYVIIRKRIFWDFFSSRTRKDELTMAMTLGGVNYYVSNYNRNNGAAQKTMQKISTGSNYPRASAGASEYAIAARLTSNIGATSQSIQNTQNISAAIKVAEGATSNTIKGLTTIKENLINAANDTNGSLDRQAIQKNVDQIIKQINSNAYVQYNGKNLLDGSQSDLVLAGIDGYSNLQLGDIRAQSLSLTDEQGNVKIDVTTPEGIQDSLKVVGGALEYVEGINGELQAHLDNGISLEAALDEATTQGAQLQRLEFQEANYVTMEENQLGALSSMNDADIAKQITNLRSEQTLEQLSLFGMKMFNQNRANILNMLP